MSEYQYYEWQSIDRLLSPEEQAAVERLSSHIEVTASHAMVDYQWGDFKHDPGQILLKYFDVHLYLANWGSRSLMFRFPKGLVDETAVEPYLVSEHISFETIGDYQVLALELHEEEGVGWVETHAALSAFAHLRDDLLQGDFRLLYLAWLKAMTLDPFWDDDSDVEAELEPPVPAGLNDLSPALNRFVEIFDLDPFLVQATAETSPDINITPGRDYQILVTKLSRNECDDYLTRLANGEPGAALALRKRLLSFVFNKPESPPSRRIVENLFDRQEHLRQAENKRKAEAAQHAHIARMKALAEYEPQMWPEIDRLLRSYSPKVYDEVTSQLVQLKQLAEFQGKQGAFHTRLAALRERYKNRSSLMQRWQRSEL